VVKAVVFSLGCTRVVSSSSDKSIRVWNANTGEIECILEGHSHGVWSVAFSPDGTGVVSGSIDNSDQPNLETGNVKHILEGHWLSVLSVALSADGTRGYLAPRTRQFGYGMRLQER
jgi:WD40 repeat protein